MTNTDLATKLRENSPAITEHVISREYERRPELVERYGERGRAFYKRDNDYHVSFLAEAIANEDPALFVDYVTWARSMLTSHGVLLEDLVKNLQLLKEAIEDQLGDPDSVARICGPIDLALAQLPSIPEAPPSFMSSELRNGDLAKEFLDCLLDGDRRRAGQLITRAVDSTVSLKHIYLDVFQRSQREVGRLWQLNQISVAEEHYCTAATLSIMNQLYPTILETPRIGLRAVCCCVEGDLHEIGLRIVADFLELEGGNVIMWAPTPPAVS